MKAVRVFGPRLIGMWVQGLVLGVLLFFALSELLRLSSGARIFRYQGF